MIGQCRNIELVNILGRDRKALAERSPCSICDTDSDLMRRIRLAVKQIAVGDSDFAGSRVDGETARSIIDQL